MERTDNSQLESRDADVTSDDENILEIDNIDIEVPRQRNINLQKRKGINISYIANIFFYGSALGSIFYAFKNKICPSVEFYAGIIGGLWTGLCAIKKYRRIRREKFKIHRILHFDYGEKEIKILTGKTPYWITFNSDENVESINKLVKKMWLYYEPAICKKIVEITEPVLQQTKPVFISSIKFKRITFGDIPFTITYIKILEEDTFKITFEAGIRWDGEAHISLSIGVVGSGYISPSVKRLNFYAAARITLTRMVPAIPCVGAMLISFQKSPHVTFDIDCGPGVGELVEAWLTPFLKNEVLGNLFVWPNRLILPLKSEQEIGSLSSLKLCTRGVLQVHVIEARDLLKADVFSKGDPFAKLETVPLQSIKTKAVNNTSHPFWNEEFYLKVQEKDQSLRVEVRDQESTLYGALSMQTSQLQGRSLIPLSDLENGVTIDKWYSLGKGDWGAEEGPGSGCGSIHLKLCYFSTEDLQSGHFFERNYSDDHKGLLFVTVKTGLHLENLEKSTSNDIFCVLEVSGIKKNSKSVKILEVTTWNENFEWQNVSYKEDLIIEVYDKNKFSKKCVGTSKVPLSILASKFKAGQLKQAIEYAAELESGNGEIVLELEWIPLDNNPITISRGVMSRLSNISGKMERGTLFIRLVSAENLKNVDLFGLTDAFCAMKIGGDVKQSKIIENNLNPVWNETFIWTHVSKKSIFRCEVLDYGPINNTKLGLFSFTLTDVISALETIQSLRFDLMDMKNPINKAKGSVNLQIYWELSNANNTSNIPVEPEWL